MAEPFIDFPAIKAVVSSRRLLEHYCFTANVRSTRNEEFDDGNGNEAEKFEFRSQWNRCE